jgi:3-oxoacyl-[acyl-carrier-protein] synthase II
MSQSTRDHMGRPIVAVTGIGIVTSLGEGKEDNWQNLTAGVSGVRKISRFPTDELRTQIAGTIDWQGEGRYFAPLHSINLAKTSAAEAIAQSAIGSRGSFPGPLFVANSPAETNWDQRMTVYGGEAGKNSSGYDRLLKNVRAGNFDRYFSLFQFASIAEHLADEFGTRGQPVSLTTACASGATSVQLGVEAIRRGDTDAALCIGTDGEICEEMVVRFNLLSALSTQNDDPQGASKPFSKTRDGFVMAEGSATLVLESYDAAKARGAKILGVVRGVGERADTFHRTRSKPDGSAIIDTITRSMADAGLSPSEIDCINAHGTSTPENDKMEYLALSAALGSDLDGTPISSNKSMIGHTLSAAGTIEAAISLLTIRDGVIPPTINCIEQDPNILMDVVPNEKRIQTINTVMSNSFGFGGQNVSLIFSAEPA